MQLGTKIFFKNPTRNYRVKFDDKPHNAWYDENCKRKYQIYKAAVEQYNRTHSDNDRLRFFAAKKDYK